MGSALKTWLLVITIQLINDITGQEMLKRIPQSLLGLRNKKEYQISGPENYFPWSVEEMLYPKRAPMGFMGMRGKKLTSNEESLEYIPKRSASLIGQIDYGNNNIDQREKFPMLDNFWNAYMEKMAESRIISNDVEKRAPQTHGFYGVRGKKDKPFDLSFRGKFIGVRGKKDIQNNDLQDIMLDHDEPWPKRKQMGFIGMRGKKWMNESDIADEETMADE